MKTEFDEHKLSIILALLSVESQQKDKYSVNVINYLDEAAIRVEKAIKLHEEEKDII